MKREKFLWPLTQSHHRALLAARRIRETLAVTHDGETVARLAMEIQTLYGTELKGHFRDEETMMDALEILVDQDDPDIARVHKDHRMLEALVPQGTRESLATFAETLKDHVRFEEDVLFVKFETLFKDDAKRVFGNLLAEHSTKGA